MGDGDLGGCHLVWSRELCHSPTALLASGDAGTPLRALIYLTWSQRPDGGFNHDFWIDGEPRVIAARLREAVGIIRGGLASDY